MKTELLYLSLFLLLTNQTTIESQTDTHYLENQIKKGVSQMYNIDSSQFLGIYRVDHISQFYYTCYARYSPNKVFRVEFNNGVLMNVTQMQGQSRFYALASQVMPHRYFPLQGYKDRRIARVVDYGYHMSVNGSGIPIPVPNGPQIPEKVPEKDNNGLPDWFPKPPSGNAIPDWMPKPPKMPELPDLFPPTPVPMPMPA